MLKIVLVRHHGFDVKYVAKTMKAVIPLGLFSFDNAEIVRRFCAK